MALSNKKIIRLYLENIDLLFGMPCMLALQSAAQSWTSELAWAMEEEVESILSSQGKHLDRNKNTHLDIGRVIRSFKKEFDLMALWTHLIFQLVT